MKYYLIFESTGNPRTKMINPTYIVERESTAKSFCKEFSKFYYEEREDGVYCTTTLGDSITKIEHSDFLCGFDFVGKGLYNDIECPYCGAKHYKVGGSSTTAMYCPIIVEDGKIVSKDRNICTTEYHCLDCGKTFKTVNGKVEK